MICSLFLIAFSDRIAPTEEVRVRNFYRTAIAPYGRAVRPFEANETPKRSEPDGTVRFRKYGYTYGMVLVEPTSGTVAAASFTRPMAYATTRRVSDEQAIKLARKYVWAAGLEMPIDTYRVKDHEGTNEAGIRVDFVPTYKGVAFSRLSGGLAIVNRETGHLEELYMPQHAIPTPPADVRPTLALDEARVTGLVALLKDGAEAVKVSQTMPLHLSIVPEPHRPKVGRLAFAMQGFDPRRVDQDSGQPDRLFYTQIDAKSGRVQTTHYPAIKFGKRYLTTTALPAESSAWRVGEDASELLDHQLEGKLSPASSDGFRRRRSAYLIHGEEGWRIEIGDDGRFCVRELDERRTYYRASGPLKDAMVALLAK